MAPNKAAWPLLVLLSAGCSGRDFVRDDRWTTHLAAHFKQAGYDAEVREEPGPYPGGAIERWTLMVPASNERQFAFPVSGEVFKFMYSSAAEDYARVVERSDKHVAVSGVYVLIVRRNSLGLHDGDHVGLRTPGFAEAHRRYIEIRAEHKKAPQGQIPWERVVEALNAEKPYFDQEWVLCVKDVFTGFQAFGRR